MFPELSFLFIFKASFLKVLEFFCFVLFLLPNYFSVFAIVTVFKSAGHFNMLLAKLREQMEEKLKNASGRDGEVTLDTGKGVNSRMVATYKSKVVPH